MGLVADVIALWNTLQQLKGLVALLSLLLIPVLRSVGSQRRKLNGTTKPVTKGLVMILLMLAVHVGAQIANSGGINFNYGSTDHGWAIPPNVFVATRSQIRTPADVVASRVQRLSASGNALDKYYDKLLLDRIASTEARLVYSVYGPEAMRRCDWCFDSDSSKLRSGLFGGSKKALDNHDYLLLYSIPAILGPYLAAVGAVLAATPSRSLAARQWRVWALVPLAVVATYDIYSLQMNTVLASVSKKQLAASAIPWVYWERLQRRALFLAGHSIALAYLVWASSTNRAFAPKEPIGSRLLRIQQQLDSSVKDVSLMNFVREAVQRDTHLEATAANHIQTAYKTREQGLQLAAKDERFIRAQDAAIERAEARKPRLAAREYLSDLRK